ncbi:MAG: hypothetical protein L3J58_11665 [Emcibacter sp.]|nr:hypothetical protein [Emcibacter sp.]
MGTTKKSDQSNASAINAKGEADETVKVVDHTAPDKVAANGSPTAKAEQAAAKADKATAKAADDADKAIERAVEAEVRNAGIAEAVAIKEVESLTNEEEAEAVPPPLANDLGLKPIKYAGDTPRSQARQKAELKATLNNLLAFDGKIESCSKGLRGYINEAREALREVGV